MGWQSSLLFTGCAFGLGSLAVVIACDYWSVDKFRAREQKRLRRRRVKSMRFLRSTAGRDVYSEFEGARRP